MLTIYKHGCSSYVGADSTQRVVSWSSLLTVYIIMYMHQNTNSTGNCNIPKMFVLKIYAVAKLYITWVCSVEP